MAAAASATVPLAATKFSLPRLNGAIRRDGDEDTTAKDTKDTKKCMRNNDTDIRLGFGWDIWYGVFGVSWQHQLPHTTTWKVVSPQLDPMQISCSYNGVADSLG